MPSQEFDAPQVTQPVLVLPASNVATAGQMVDDLRPRPLKSHVLTVGGLLLAVTVGWGGFTALATLSDRATTARRAAVANHDHDYRAHPGLQALVRQQGLRVSKELEAIRTELKEIHRLLSLRPKGKRR